MTAPPHVTGRPNTGGFETRPLQELGPWEVEGVGAGFKPARRRTALSIDTSGITMDEEKLAELLEGVRRGGVTVDEALERLQHLPFEDLGFAKVDHHRALRQGFPEVIMGEGKEVSDIADIARAIRKRGDNVLITRLSQEKMDSLKTRLRGSATTARPGPPPGAPRTPR